MNPQISSEKAIRDTTAFNVLFVLLLFFFITRANCRISISSPSHFSAQFEISTGARNGGWPEGLRLNARHAWTPPTAIRLELYYWHCLRARRHQSSPFGVAYSRRSGLQRSLLEDARIDLYPLLKLRFEPSEHRKYLHFNVFTPRPVAVFIM